MGRTYTKAKAKRAAKQAAALERIAEALYDVGFDTSSAAVHAAIRTLRMEAPIVMRRFTHAEAKP